FKEITNRDQALHLSTAGPLRLACSPGSKFKRHGGSILNRRQHSVERRITHPAVSVITATARGKLFARHPP
ncbi:MAG: hypothetical protein LCH71_18105, partial [Proteobacteria bacterium]|nr:hypothetical protein [Pseudomonadota bacterium]